MTTPRYPASTDLDAETLRRYDRPGPRYTSYPSADRFHDGVGPHAARDALVGAAHAPGPIALYLHLPFCEHRCLYCACNVVITRRRDVADPYLDRLVAEADLVAGALGATAAERRPVAQLHLGGGTPTYYAPDQLDRLLSRLEDRFRFTPNAERSVEIDPRVTRPEHLEILAGHGFQRLSVGVQDVDPQVQKAVHREQSQRDTEEQVRLARSLGFGSVNVDLIYGLPHQTRASFARTIDEVLTLGPDRLAVYSFAFVPWIRPHQKLLDRDAMPTGIDKHHLLADARGTLLARGYHDVGMDHFARHDDELAVAQREGRLHRNFMGYTTMPAADLIGLGVSAIGFVGGTFLQNAKKLSAWNRAIDSGQLATERGYRRTSEDALRGDVIHAWMCGLRIDKRAIEARHGVAFDAAFAGEMTDLEAMEEDGFVVLRPETIEAGPLGRPFARNVAMVFDPVMRERRGADEGPRYSRTV